MSFKQLEFHFATRFDPPKDPGITFEKESRAHQEFAKECDINYTMQRYTQTGQLPSGDRVPLNPELIVERDFQAMQDRVVAARESFDALPSRLRDRFGNDPQRLFDFLSDKSNRDEAVKLGLIAAGEPGAAAGDSHTPAAAVGGAESGSAAE